MPATKTRFPPRSVVRITMTINGLTRCAAPPAGQDGPDRFRRGSDVRGGGELLHERENTVAWREGTTRRSVVLMPIGRSYLCLLFVSPRRRFLATKFS
jgi:hypothetical protein